MKKFISSFLLSSVLMISGSSFGASDKVDAKFEAPAPLVATHNAEFTERVADVLAETDKDVGAVVTDGKTQMVFVIDISGSMAVADEHPQGKAGEKGLLEAPWSRFDSAYAFVRYTARTIAEFDADGHIPVYFFGSDVKKVDVKVKDAKGSITTAELLKAFRDHKPGGSTNLLGALNQAFSEQISALKADERILFVCVTDGIPDSSPQSIHDAIKAGLTDKDAGGDRLNILFVQAGKDEPAKAFLKGMDDAADIGNNVDRKSTKAAWEHGPKLMIANAFDEKLDGTFAND